MPYVPQRLIDILDSQAQTITLVHSDKNRKDLNQMATGLTLLIADFLTCVRKRATQRRTKLAR